MMFASSRNTSQTERNVKRNVIYSFSFFHFIFIFIFIVIVICSTVDFHFRCVCIVGILNQFAENSEFAFVPREHLVDHVPLVDLNGFVIA